MQKDHMGRVRAYVSQQSWNVLCFGIDRSGQEQKPRQERLLEQRIAAVSRLSATGGVQKVLKSALGSAG
jgi:hypothetical protein